jgi:hypothetical protein
LTNILRDMTMERDHFELTLGDTLDVKAVIVLALITVLGTLTGSLLASGTIGKELQTIQMLSLTLLALGAFFAVMTMVPRDYLLPDMPDKYTAWLDELKEYYKDNPGDLDSKAAEGLAQVAAERIAANHDLNSSKSRYLVISFWLTIAALTLNMLTLAALGVSKLLS